MGRQVQTSEAIPQATADGGERLQMSPKDVNGERAMLCMRFILKANFVQKIYYLAHVDQLQVKTVQGVSVIFLQQMANLVKLKASLL